MKTIIRKVIYAFIAIVIVLCGLVAVDIYRDRQHIVIVAETATLYADLSINASVLKPVAIVFPAEKLEVMRIRYEKASMRIQVKTADGTTGWLWLDKGVKLSKK